MLFYENTNTLEAQLINLLEAVFQSNRSRRGSRAPLLHGCTDDGEIFSLRPYSPAHVRRCSIKAFLILDLCIRHSLRKGFAGKSVFCWAENLGFHCRSLYLFLVRL